MNRIIQNPTFLTEPTGIHPQPVLDVLLINHSHPATKASSMEDIQGPEVEVTRNDDPTLVTELDMRGGPPRKKARGVRFADDDLD